MSWNNLPNSGVYPGMFENTLILDSGRQKPWTMFAGLSGQLFALGVAMLVPLVYTDRLPLFRISELHIAMPISAPKPVSDPPATTERHPSAPRARVHPGGLVAPPAVPQTLPEIDDRAIQSAASSDAPYIPGAPTGTGNGLGVLPQAALVPPPPVADTHPARVEKPPVSEKPVTRVKAGGDVQAARILNRVLPVYPPLARQARVSGSVQLLGIIGRDGRVQQLQVISGHPLLVNAALDAVRQWIYRPTLLNGDPVEVVAPIEVKFILAQ